MPVTNYIWDVENDSLLMETDENGATTAVYTNEPDEFGSVISQNRAGTTSTYHYDGLGSTRALTDSSGTVTDTYEHTAFGETISQTGSTTNPFRYVGEKGYYYDNELDSYYVRERVYQPLIARWTSIDSIRFATNDNTSLFNYTLNNPLLFVDPSGQIITRVGEPRIVSQYMRHFWGNQFCRFAEDYPSFNIPFVRVFGRNIAQYEYTDYEVTFVLALKVQIAGPSTLGGYDTGELFTIRRLY